MGRPTKYRKEFNDEVVALGADGKTDCEIAVALGITTQTLYQWARDKKEFSYSLKKAHDACDAWFVNTFRTAIFGGKVDGKEINPVPLMFLAKTQRHWREKWDIEVKTTESDDLHKFDKLFDESR
jgi:transcriptional regulator with XRE-family HTH domain